MSEVTANQPNGTPTWVDLGIPDLARPFYAQVFDFTLDGNDDMADFDFTFLRSPTGTRSHQAAYDMVYGRIAVLHDPFGTELSIITRAAAT